MLSGIRKRTGGLVTQIFLGILVISFAVWGIADIFKGFRADSVVSVGGTDVTARTFATQYQIALNQLRQQVGRDLTPDQAKAFGLPSQVLGQLVSQATLDDAASSLKLGLSNDELARKIAADPTFRGPDGNFSRGYFTQILQANGYDENRYVADQRKVLVRQQIGEALVGGTEAPEPYLQAFHQYQTEARDLSYIVLTEAIAGDVGEPTDAELTAHFDANKANWKAPEYRTLSLLRLTPADIAKPNEVSDEDAKKIYEASLDKYTTKEKRRVEQIVFTDAGDAAAGAAEVASGRTFDDVVAGRNLKQADIDLGLVTRDHFADNAVGDIAFSLPVGQISDTINGQFGTVMLRVTEIQPEAITTFDAAKADIKKQIAEQRAAQEIFDQHDLIEDERAAGSTLAETAQKYGLKLMPVAAVDKSGKGQDEQPVAELPGGNDLIAAAFESDVGNENDPIQIDNRTGYVWYEVTGVTPARDRTLDEVRDAAIAAWKKSKADEKVLAKANEIRDRVAKGEALATIAGELAVEVKTADQVTRNTTASGDFSSASLRAAFDGPRGHAATAPGGADGTTLVLTVTGVTTPTYSAEATGMGDVIRQLKLQVSNDLLSQYIGEMQNDLGVTINEAALQSILARPGG